VIQEDEGGQGYYRIGLEMVPLDPPVAAGGSGTGTTYTGSAFAGAQAATATSARSSGTTRATWERPGSTLNPTVGPLSQVGSPFAYTKLTTSVAITVRVSAQAGFAAVFSAGGDALMTCTSSVNGIIATGALGAAPAGGFASGNCTIELASYAMAAGEVLTFTGSYHGLLGAAAGDRRATTTRTSASVAGRTAGAAAGRGSVGRAVVKITAFDELYSRNLGTGTVYIGGSNGSNSGFAGGDVVGEPGDLSVVGLRRTVALSSNLTGGIGDVLTIIATNPRTAQFATPSNTGRSAPTR
jgi:hypothetical protein